MSEPKDRPRYKRILIDVAGFSLMIIAPFLGWLPGPGGIPLFLIGLSLVATNHEWAANLLKDFDKKRVELTEKYLMTSPRVSLAIDISGILIICATVYLALTAPNFFIRLAGFGTSTFTLIIILSNQRRFERLLNWFKNLRK
jgi:hypothetical protein